MKTRVQEIDILRSIAIILIVCSHIGKFTHLTISDRLSGIFAFFGLSIFFFISGFLMYSNNNFITTNDMRLFFKNRVAKIYPLYWFSIITIYAMNKTDLNVVFSNNIDANKFVLLLNVLGLQGLISKSYDLSVWWFLGVILLYYLLFSIILYYSKDFKSVLKLSFLVALLFLFLRKEFNLIHIHFFSYYFVFIAGILSAAVNNLRSLKDVTISYLIFLLIFLSMSYFGVNTSNLTDINVRDVIFLIFIFIFTFFKTKFSFNGRFKFSLLFEKLADSSYSIYLFHIPVLTLFSKLLNLLTPSWYIYDYFMIFISIPFTLLSGYYIMKCFNKYYRKIIFKNI